MKSLNVQVILYSEGQNFLDSLQLLYLSTTTTTTTTICLMAFFPGQPG